ncbi:MULTISPECIES: cyclic nucleotide-binding domain-containing protein [Streptomyces]|uniref:cyclic nucleotide-binding domain-containing protein n=1 Tax=Streptomyces TaxID=1883 RepID=UPI00201CE21B|nr:cyclic nucleotide-binding domain-containing protein [Streptomyces panaciradicis]MCL6669965.1 cyclic nucleotide-binding domain-containing protein [Streptomyces panaciradicis]
MNAPATSNLTRALSPEYRERLMGMAREVSYPEGARLFEEGGHADRFWIIRTGTVDLDMRVPGRQAAVIDSLGHNELLGWSWLYPPHTWHLGAEAVTPLRAYQFDAAQVRAECQRDAEFGRTVAEWVGRIVAHRLQAARTRLLDLYGPYGSGGLR